MDRVSESLLNEFSSEHELTHLTEEKRFEHFACFITVGRHYSETFDTEDILIGSATGIDGIAIIVNGNLVTDVESLEEADSVGELDVTFVFVQADRSPGFDAAKIGNFGFATMNFFKEQPTLPRNEEVKAAADIMSAVYNRSSKFKRGNPVCRLYYATTGKWVDDPILEGRRKAVTDDLEGTNLFREVTFVPLGQRAFRSFTARRRMPLPASFSLRTALLSQRYLG